MAYIVVKEKKSFFTCNESICEIVLFTGDNAYEVSAWNLLVECKSYVFLNLYTGFKWF